jgi:antitoxin ParD1/3/4
MNVSLPKEQKAFVDKRVEDGGFGSVSDYVRELIRRDQRELQREEVEQRLLAALESKRSEMTEKDWKELRATLTKRHTKSRGS